MKPLSCFFAAVIFATLLVSAAAQTSNASPQTNGVSVQVPRLIRFSATAKDETSSVRTGLLGMTFALYQEEQGGAPLWVETQTVRADSTGHYTTMLGSSKPEGLPVELFTSVEAQWLGVRIEGQAEQPRVLLVSVPYALKAYDAETVGGLRPEAFVLAGPAGSSTASTTTATVAVTPAVSGSGTANFLPIWTNNTGGLGNSTVYQTGGNVGIGNTAPGAKLDVSGGGIIRGLLSLPPTAGATSTAGTNSNALDLTASSFSTTISQAVNQDFRWQAEPVGNNTTSPTGKLNLLYGLGSTMPSETGLSISNGGALTVRGLTLPSVGTASSTSTAGFSSRPMDLLASAWNTSGTPAAVSPHFRLQAEPAGSNTTSPSGTLNLLYSAGSAALAETGLKIASSGRLTFAPGQTFPGTVTSVGLAAPTSDFVVSGSPVTSAGTLNLAWNVVPTSAATANAIVKRDGSGNFSAGTITANLSGSVVLPVGTAATPSLSFAGNTNSGIFSPGAGSFGIATGGIAGLTLDNFGRMQLYSNIPNLFPAVPSITIGNPGGLGSAAFFLGKDSTDFLEVSWINPNFARITTQGQPLVLQDGGLGNVGIGTETPSHKLEVIDTSNTGLRVQTNTAGGSVASFGGNGDFAIDAPGTAGGRFIVKDTSGHVGIGTVVPATYLHVDHAVAPPGADLIEISSGGAPDVASLLLQNTFSGGQRLRVGAGTGEAYLASSGTLAFHTGDTTGSPSFPGGAVITIDTSGNVNIPGTVSKGGGSFKIDHPLDPATKYLYHSFVESPDMMNVYNGNVVTDRRGVATVVLPEYFEALNRDFRYQLTVIGQFSQAIVAQEIRHNRFTIKTSKPRIKVSWQVTGIRQDAFANAYRIPVEQDKPPQEQGRYLHPELFGVTAEQAIGAASPTLASTGQ